MPTPINLFDFDGSNAGGRDARITQLYEHLELFSEGDPQRQSLFVLGQPPMSALAAQTGGAANQLLLIDPPSDVTTRFELTSNLAALFTSAAEGQARDGELPLLQTQPGGVAHIQIGQHYLDIYSQRGGNVVHFPALGVICGGPFGSDALVPALASQSKGDEELETLRLLAGLVKRRLQLYIPHTGTTVSDPVDAMQRLAADVAYLHGLRRVVPALDADAVTDELTESLLPAGRRGTASRALHAENLQRLLNAA